MTNEIANMNQCRLNMPANLSDIDSGQWKVLAECIFPTAKTAEAIVMAVDYCRARKLDVMKKMVHIVPMWNSSLGREVETVWAGINEVQVTASRTGKYAGMDEPKWGNIITRKFTGTRKYKDGNAWKEEVIDLNLEFPEWCSVTVYRIVEGHRCAFTEPVYWLESYAHAGKTDCPNPMWAKRPRGQILKVAKAFSLRAAFPEEGEYTAEEMEGKEIEAGGIVIDVAKNNITPSETDYSKPASPFKNATLRNTFHKNVVENFHKARNCKELEQLILLDKEKLDLMNSSGSEADQMSLDEIRKQYKIARSRLLKIEEESTEPEEEIKKEEYAEFDGKFPSEINF